MKVCKTSTECLLVMGMEGNEEVREEDLPVAVIPKISYRHQEGFILFLFCCVMCVVCVLQVIIDCKLELFICLLKFTILYYNHFDQL